MAHGLERLICSLRDGVEMQHRRLVGIRCAPLAFANGRVQQPEWPTLGPCYQVTEGYKLIKTISWTSEALDSLNHTLHELTPRSLSKTVNSRVRPSPILKRTFSTTFLWNCRSIVVQLHHLNKWRGTGRGVD